MLNIFQFRDSSEIEALVLAVDFVRAEELFTIHLQEYGGDPDTLLFRELSLEQLEDSECAVVKQALDLGVDGLVVYGEQDRWFFVTPLGADGESNVSG